jgi:antitoxin (DNA-binding transcriptional repressor) of toxin-antitoxin stability system
MTLHGQAYEVGIRELHDRLSEHLDRVEHGAEVVVTRRGKPVARLTRPDDGNALDDLVRRGLVTLPERPRAARSPRIAARGSVSEFVAEQRR